jgi:hypothetical protein
MTLGNEDTTIEVAEIVRDTVSHISLDGSGDIEITNGDLDIGGNYINDESGNRSYAPTFRNIYTGSDNNIRLYDDSNSQDILRAKVGGDVEIPSGDITDGTNVIFDQSANHVPSSIVETAGLDADTVDGFEADELRNSKNVAQLSSTNTTLDINQASWVSIPFDVQLTLDAAYTHDASGAPETITFDEAGTYRVYVSLSYDSNGNTRVNPGIKFNINGTRLDTFGLTGYARANSGHDEASNTVSRLIDVSAGDTLQVQTIEMSDAGTVTMRSNESVLAIEQLSSSTAPISDADTLDGLDSTAFVKTDGSTPITSTQAINQAEGADYLTLNNTTTGDSWDLTIGGTSSFDFDVNNNEVFTVDPANQQATFSSRLYGSSGFDAGGDSIDNSTEVNTPGGGSDSFTVYDSSNGQDIARFNEGGDVYIPNGDLDLSGGSSQVENVNYITQNPEFGNLGLWTDGSGGGQIRLYDDANNQAILYAYEGGNVEIPNGDLSTSGKHTFTNSSASFKYSSTNDEAIIERPDGADAITIGSNGNVTINNGRFDAVSNGASIDGGNLLLNQNKISNVNGIIGGDAFLSLETRGNDGSDVVTMYGTANSHDIARFIDGGTVQIPNGNLQVDSDGASIDWGENQDFGIFYEAASDELVLEDANGVELIRQPKGGATQFLQGADIGSIESPEDSFTQLVNAAVTADAASGDTVGYTLAVDNQTALEATATADGSGGLSDGPNVDVPNGELQVTSGGGVISVGDGSDSAYTHDISTSGSSTTVMEMRETGTNIWSIDNLVGASTPQLRFYDRVNSTETMSLFAGGNVSIPNGDLLDGASNIIYDQSQNGIPAERILGTLGVFEDTDSDNVAELISDFTGIRFADGETTEFGSSGDMSERFDASNDELRWSDETNTADRMALDRTTGDLSIEGEITEGASL